MIGFLFIWFLLVIYSFTRQDLNLTWYNQLTVPLQTLGWFHRPLATQVFVILSLVFIVIYLKLIRSGIRWPIFFLIASAGILAYPMFSYDLFNYLFNAKMVWIYHANPHIATAIEFSHDPMLRFMQNIHTPAPYAYGWTLASLLPGLAWFSQKFTLAFWSMKLFVALFWLGQLWILKKLIVKLFPKEQWRFWLFALNPLVLVETLIVGHNDVVMMLPVLLSFWLLLKSKKLFDKNFNFALGFWLFSVSIKHATVVLLPLYFIYHLLKRLDFATIAAVLLLAVMLTRPGQLHSWYLIWSFSFVVLSPRRWLVALVTALTFGGLLRYAPYIYYGHWDPPVYLLRNLIWFGALVFIPLIPLNKR